MLNLTCFTTRSNLKFYKNGASHMTKLASMPIYHKPLKSSSKLMRNPMVFKSGRNERGSGFKMFIKDGPVLTLTCSIWSHLIDMLISYQAHTRMCSERLNGHWFSGSK